MEIKLPEYEFPEFYNEDYLVLLVRDPHCLYAYWEISSDLRNSLQKEFGEDRERLPLILRVYDITGLDCNNWGYHSYFDIQLRPLANNYFIEVTGANRTFCVELGICGGEGEFTTLLRSNIAHTPRENVADGSDDWIMQPLLERAQAQKNIQVGTYSHLGIYGSSDETDK